MKNVVSKKSNRRPSLFARVVALIEEARQKVASVANLAQVYTNYEIGRQIVEEEQGGKRRAEYGKQVLIDLSSRLSSRFGRGFSVDNLQNMRSFYLVYSAIEIYDSCDDRRTEAGHETRDIRRASCLTTFPIVSHLMSHAHPIHRKEPTHD